MSSSAAMRLPIRSSDTTKSSGTVISTVPNCISTNKVPSPTLMTLPTTPRRSSCPLGGGLSVGRPLSALHDWANAGAAMELACALVNVPTAIRTATRGAANSLLMLSNPTMIEISLSLRRVDDYQNFDNLFARRNSRNDIDYVGAFFQLERYTEAAVYIDLYECVIHADH